MSQPDRSSVLAAVLLFLAALLLLILICLLFPMPSKAQHIDDLRPQVLLVYDHKQNGKYVVAAKAQPVLLLRQEDPEARLAPIEPGTLMLCRPYSDGSHLVFRCGQDKFVMEAISFQPEK